MQQRILEGFDVTMGESQTARIRTLRINDVPIRNVSMPEALDLIDDCIDGGKRRSFFFVNAHCINVSATDPAYHRILLDDDAIVFGDGAGIRFARYISRQPPGENVNGTDLFPELCARAATRKRSFFLLGARPGVPDEVARRIVTSHPGLRVAGIQHGYFDEMQTDSLVAAINASGADVLLVALGVPRQEHWIAAHRAKLDAPVVIAVGGLFDYYGGRIPRAPKFLRKALLEWAWRLAMEPRRMWRRYLVGNFTFMGRIIWWALKRGNRAN
jgi:N-acetylglucosaminyldiphosphoundecaprenol N-acetyl-beta-D-mannosaminyltransferase